MTEVLNQTHKYFQYLIDEAENLLKEGKYYQVASRILVAHNNLKSGWTYEIDELFFFPNSPEEEELVAKMKNIILRTLEGLLPNAKAGKSFSDLVLLQLITRLLFRLRFDAPKEFVDRTRLLLQESETLGANSDMVCRALNLISDEEI